MVFLADDAATLAFGQSLARQLVPGDLITLTGDLGAGKTALARAIIRSLSNDPALDVPSPSFALVQPYQTPGGPVLHADLYRLGDEREADELGLLDDPAAIVLVEWPDRAPSLAAAASIAIVLTIPRGGQGRELAITANRPLS